MASLSVITSYNRLEWWNAHLASALTAKGVQVANYPASGHGEAGYGAELSILELIGRTEGSAVFYLGSVAHLFRGITDLRIPTAIWTDILLPLNFEFLPCLRLFDVVFCTQKESVPAVIAAGAKQAEWMPFAYDTTLDDVEKQPKQYDIGFIGSLDQPETCVERRQVLSMLEARYKINDYRRPLYGKHMINTYRRSRIVVNIPVPGGFNMRTFEALASGSLLLTKAVGNGQADLFKDGTHLVTYRDTNDLVTKVDYYLRNERERETIAEAGRREVLSRHTYQHRAENMLDYMRRVQKARTRDPNTMAAAYLKGCRLLDRSDLIAQNAFARGLSVATRIRLVSTALRQLYRGIKRLRG